jgi:hypothetical protein
MKPTHVLHCSMVGIKRKGGVSHASFSGSQRNVESMRCSAARRGVPTVCRCRRTSALHERLLAQKKCAEMRLGGLACRLIHHLTRCNLFVGSFAPNGRRDMRSTTPRGVTTRARRP